MPYIKQSIRNEIDPKLYEMIAEAKDAVNNDQLSGEANYLVTKAVLHLLKPDSGWTYDALANTIKTLECSKLEIYRRLMGPYEDGAVIRNGDLPEFVHQQYIQKQLNFPK